MEKEYLVKFYGEDRKDDKVKEMKIVGESELFNILDKKPNVVVFKIGECVIDWS
jgi:hypothetical protein